MIIKECYYHMGADYEGVLRRIGKEDLLLRFLCRLLEEDSYASLQKALDAGDTEAAFRAAHSLKGICMNMGLTLLCRSSSALAEELRDGKITPAATSLFDQVTQDYQTMVRNTKELLRTQEM